MTARRSALVLAAALAFGSAPPAAFAADAPDAPAKAPARTPEQMAALRKLVLDGLASASPKNRTAAAQALIAAWPDSAPIFDEVLNSKSPSVRLEAVNLLDTPSFGDQRERAMKRFEDADADVRRQAVRIAGRFDWPEAEPALIRIASGDPLWPVRQEALRTLERRGSVRCLTPVLDGLIAEKDQDRKKRFRRVLIAILNLDRGDDEAAWREAIVVAQRSGISREKPVPATEKAAK